MPPIKSNAVQKDVLHHLPETNDVSSIKDAVRLRDVLHHIANMDDVSSIKCAVRLTDATRGSRVLATDVNSTKKISMSKLTERSKLLQTRIVCNSAFSVVLSFQVLAVEH